jgi:hypothetical protein
VEYEVREWPRGAVVALTLSNEEGLRVALTCDVEDSAAVNAPRSPGQYRARVCIPPGVLVPGTYYVTPAIYEPATDQTLDAHERCVRFEVRGTHLLLTRFGVPYPTLLNLPALWHTQRAEAARSRPGGAPAMQLAQEP